MMYIVCKILVLNMYILIPRKTGKLCDFDISNKYDVVRNYSMFSRCNNIEFEKFIRHNFIRHNFK